MSSRIRPNVNQELMNKEFVSTEDKTSSLATAIYETSKTHPFMGSVLQCLNIAYSHQLPTAGIMFNADAKRWDMLINPYFFAKKLSAPERKAVLLHELSHITHKHPLRVPFMKISAHKRQLMNIAADMAINQFIKDLPKGCPQCPPPDSGKPCENELCPGRCIDVAEYFDEDAKNPKNKIPWPKNIPMESYYEKLIQRFDDPENGENGDQDMGDGGSQSNGQGQGQGKGKGNAGGGANTKDLPQTIDEHLWDGSSDEKDMLDATEELVKRAMVKARLSYDDIPGHVKELLDDIKARRAELNYRALIMAAMKKHAAGHDRKHTWTRKSKRFGYKSPGTKVGELPKLELHLDSSGSISIEELNEFLEIVDQFLKVGARKCNLSFFHTELYGRRSYKMGAGIDRSEVQSGGTDLTQTLEDIFTRRGDLSCIITDGCYSDVNWEQWLRPGEQPPQILWIISKGGIENHPLKRLGDTVKCPDATTGRK
jgi:predicted metal-dependent peptidase